MKLTTLTATALATVLVCAPAFAGSSNTTMQTSTSGSIEHGSDAPANPTLSQRFEKGMEETKEAVSNAADATGAAMKSAAQKISDLVSDKEPDVNGAYPETQLEGQASAKTFIGQDVVSYNNEKVATVDDVIIDKNGDVSKVILSNGGIMGIGDKLVAVDYNLLYKHDPKGDVIVPLSEETIKQMTPFSYDPTTNDNRLVTLAPDETSVKYLLDGDVIDTSGKTVASIEDITFVNGKATSVVASYGQTLGMGGHLFAVNYNQLTEIKADDDTTNVRFSPTLTAKFENFKKNIN